MTPTPSGPGPNPLADRIRSVRSRPRSGARVADRRTSLTDGDLLAAAGEASRHLRHDARRERPMVAAVLPLSTDALVLLVAAVLGDFSLCFVDPAGTAERRAGIIGALAPDVVVDAAGTSVADRSDRPDRQERGAGYVAMSSGSTGGGPKGVLSSWTSIGAFVPFGAEALELDASAAWAEVSHLSYDLAMTNLLIALATGCSVHVSSSLGDRLRPLGFTERVGATHLRAAPGSSTSPRTSVRGLRTGACGCGAPAATGCPRPAPGRSSTSASPRSSTPTGPARPSASPAPPGCAPVTRCRPCTAPSPSAGDSWAPGARALHERGPDSMLGIESPHLPDGYLFGRAPGDYPLWEGTDRVLTGDLGAQLDGDLYCLGRAGRRVKRSASFVDLDQIDAMLRERHGLTSFTVSTPAGRLVTLVEGQPGRLAEVARLLPGELRPDTLPDELVPVRALPRLGNGKTDQAEAQRLAEEADCGARGTG